MAEDEAGAAAAGAHWAALIRKIEPVHQPLPIDNVPAAAKQDISTGFK